MEGYSMESSSKWTKLRRFNKHHLTPRSRGGKKSSSNLLRLDVNRHRAWHLIFGNKTIYEIIRLLERVVKIKQTKNKEVMDDVVVLDDLRDDGWKKITCFAHCEVWGKDDRRLLIDPVDGSVKLRYKSKD